MTPEPVVAGQRTVPALPYHLDADTGWTLEVRLIIAGAMLAGVQGLSTFATSLWIYFQPGRFRTVGAFRSAWSAEFAIFLLGVAIDLTLIAGGAAFFARRRVCRPLLIAGSAGKLLLAGVTMVYYTFFHGGTGRYGADLAVWLVWRSGSFLISAIVPVLTVAVMTRPYVKARFRSPTDE